MATHEFKIMIGSEVATTVSGDDRAAAINEAARYAMMYVAEGFQDVLITGVEQEDFDAITDTPGWPKTVVQ